MMQRTGSLANELVKRFHLKLSWTTTASSVLPNELGLSVPAAALAAVFMHFLPFFLNACKNVAFYNLAIILQMLENST